MNQKFLEKYAELILKNGVHLIKGQNLVIRAEPIHWPFINILIKKAYQLGANQIRTDVFHPCAHIYRTLYQKKEYLNQFPSYLKTTNNAYIGEHWARILIDGHEDPEIFSLANQENNSIIQKAAALLNRQLSQATVNGECTWTIVPMPTPKWAKKVLSGNKNIAKMNDQQLVEAFWKVLTPILRLDHSDPSKAWKKHSDTLKKRIKHLNSLEIECLHFEDRSSGKTDLKIYLANDASWCGGNFSAYDGRPFLPNIPTEEVFSCPHYLKTEGTVRVTRPVKVFGEEVVGAQFEFARGKVIAYGAKKRKHLLDKYFKIDEKARFLGEVALVDRTSPIYQANLIFDSILLDENASCHIALGDGIPSSIVGGTKLSEKELAKRGCNHSLLHTDFMIGSDDLKITAYLRQAKKKDTSVVIIQDGKFTF